MPPPVETVSSWAMNASCDAPVMRPTSVEELRAAITCEGSAGLRGTGCSYGDASINSGGRMIDCTHFNRIISFDAETGILVAEPGVTIEQVWRHALPLGWWPAVVPGTMYPTLGGCLAMNIHGKNNFQASTIGTHVRAFDLMLADGSIRTCSRDAETELFHAAIGGFGMLGAFCRIELQLKKVHSGDLWVKAIAGGSLRELIEVFEREHDHSDYLVGWVDALGGGRGLIHQAWYLSEGEDPKPDATFQQAHQDLPSRLFGVVPKSLLWPGLWCFFHRPGMRLVNAVKQWSGKRHARKPRYRQSLVGFSFLLDYVPNWKFAYKPGAFIQYQTFVPKETAAATFEAQLRLCKEHGIEPFLGVLKKHQEDPFLMTHAVDGYSLALDIPLGRGKRDRLWKLTAAMDEVVLAAGGRFYLAKDSTLTPEGFRTAYPPERLDRFLELKRALDPGGRFQTDLSRRLLGPTEP